MTTTVTLTREQRRARDGVLKNLQRKQIQTVGGYAGTGKSFVLSTLADDLPDFAVGAFTGKASDILRRRRVGRARTLHSLIYTWTRPAAGGRYVLKTRGEIDFAGVLIDEGSMIGVRLFKDLKSFGLPLVVVGDFGQLPPVKDLDPGLMREEALDYKLATIHRHAGALPHFARHLRLGGRPWKFRDGGSAVRVVSRHEVDDAMQKRRARAGQIIVARNSTRVSINSRCRRLLGRKGLLEDGDKVICLKNYHESGLFNGMQGRANNVDLASNTFDFESNGRVIERVRFDPDVFGEERPDLMHHWGPPHPFDYGICVTAHKAQGDEWDRVLVYDELHPWWSEPERWRYTAASRAKEKLVWATN
jgi:exodeoxyribonuclease-5